MPDGINYRVPPPPPAPLAPTPRGTGPGQSASTMPTPDQRANKVQHYRTATAIRPPDPNSLAEGEFFVEMNTPMRVWVGVPVALDPDGHKKLFDQSTQAGIPDAPVDGQSYARRGQDGTWQPAVLTAGGTMTGPLTLSGNPTQPLQAVPMQWVQANFAPIAGGGYVMKVGDSMSGPLSITSASGPALNIFSTGASWAGIQITSGTISPNTAVYINARKNNLNRWQLMLGDTDPETGSNAGSNLRLFAYADNGTQIGTPGQPYILIERANGTVHFNTNVQLYSPATLTLAADAAAPLQPVSLQQMNAGLALYLPLTGGTLTGPGNLRINGTLTTVGAVTFNNTLLVQGQLNAGANIAAGGTISTQGAFRSTGATANVFGSGYNAITLTPGAVGGGAPIVSFSGDANVSPTFSTAGTGVFNFANPLILSRNAVQPLEAVPLQQMNAALALYLPLTGGTLTGALHISYGGKNAAFYVDTTGTGLFTIDVNNQGGMMTFDDVNSVINNRATVQSTANFLIRSSVTNQNTSLAWWNTANSNGAGISPAAGATGGGQLIIGPAANAGGQINDNVWMHFFSTPSAVAQIYCPLSVLNTLAVSGTSALNGVVTVGTNGASNGQVIINGVAGSGRFLSFRTSNSERWRMRANGVAESGGNAGSNFELIPFADDGVTQLTTAMAVTRATSAVQFNADVTVGNPAGSNVLLDITGYILLTSSGSPVLRGNTLAAGQACLFLNGQRNGANRWSMLLGTTEAETGGDAGSNFLLSCFADDGTPLYTSNPPLKINRVDGLALVSGDPVQPLGIATKQYVDNTRPVPSNLLPIMDSTAFAGTRVDYSRADHVHPSDTSRLTQAQGDARYLQLTGGVMTGELQVLAPVNPQDAVPKTYVDNINPAGKYVLIMGDTMEGSLLMGGYVLSGLPWPQNNLDAVPKEYVDDVVNTQALWQGVYNADTNTPDLSTIAVQNEYSWTADTASSTGMTPLLVNLPGMPAGTTIDRGSQIIYSSVEGQWFQVYGSSLTREEAELLFVEKAGDTMTGPLTMNNGAGIGFASAFGNNPSDAQHHISLYPGWGGFSITSGRLNIFSALNGGGGTYMVVNNTDVLSFQQGGVYAYAPVILASNATAPLQAVPLQQLQSVTAGYLPLAGGTMTGDLHLANNVRVAWNDASGGSMRMFVQPDNNFIWVGTDANGADRMIASLYMHNSTANFVFNPNVQFNASAQILGGNLSFGATSVQASPQNLSRGIDLYNGTYGFGVSTSQLNYNVAAGASHNFYVGGTLDFWVSPSEVASYQPVLINANGGAWSSFNMGKQLLITGTQNNAVGISDSSGSNYVAMVNSGGTLGFFKMPLPTNSTTPPTQLLSLTTSAATFYENTSVVGTLSAYQVTANQQTGSGWVSLIPMLGAGTYNPLAQAGDFGEIFTNGTVGTGALVIGPWSASANGIRITDGTILLGGNVYFNGSLIGPITIQSMPSATSAQLNLTEPAGQANSLQSKIRFFGTFGGTIADLTPRFVASLRAGLVGAWGSEYFSLFINNGGVNDAVSDANQTEIARFTLGQININAPTIFTAHATFQQGIDFSNAIVGSVTDLSRGINFWGGTFGFNITSGRLNYNVGTATDRHVFVVGGTDALTIQQTYLTTAGSALVQGSLQVNANIAGITTGGSLGTLIANNLTQGQGDTDFINLWTGAGGFRWYQATGATTIKQLASLDWNGNVNLNLGGGIAYSGLSGGGNIVGFTWSGGFIHGFVDGNDQGGLATTGYVNGSYMARTSVGAGAWDPNAVVPATYIGSFQVTNQTGAPNWPADNGDQTAFILHGYNSNPGWQTQLMMGGRRGSGSPLPAIWYRSNTDEAGNISGWTPWIRLMGNAGGTFNGSVNFKYSSAQTFSPNTSWQTTGNGADQNIWDTYVNGTLLFMRAVNDAYTASNPWLTVSRSGYTPTQITFAAPVTVSADHLVVNTGGGSVGLYSGGGNPGYLAIFNASGVRVGYVGFQNGSLLSLQTENGMVGWIANGAIWSNSWMQADVNLQVGTGAQNSVVINPNIQVFNVTNKRRWAFEIYPTGTSNETGGNAGSNFYLERFDDGGNFIDSSMMINRASGLITYHGNSYQQGSAAFDPQVTGGEAPVVIQGNQPNPQPNWGGGLGFNYSGGQCELDFFNKYNGAVSFAWYNVVNATTTNRLAYMSPDGSLHITGALTAPQFVGTQSGGGSAAALRAMAPGNATIAWQDTSAAANSQKWDALAAGGSLYFRMMNDSESSAPVWMQVNRSAGSLSSIQIQSPTIYLQGHTQSQGGIDFNNNIGSTPQDLSGAINLWGGLFGFCVTSANLNYNVNSQTDTHHFWCGGYTVATLSTTAIGLWAGTTTVNGNLTLNAGGGWTSGNVGKQLYITTPTNASHPSIAITDATGVNLWGITNSTGILCFASMPAYSDNTTAPLNLLTISRSTGQVYIRGMGPGSVAPLLLDNGDSNQGVGSMLQIRFGYQQTQGQYAHWIASRHDAVSQTRDYGNAIDFYLSDGTPSGSYPANSYWGGSFTAYGLSIPNGSAAAPSLNFGNNTMGGGTQVGLFFAGAGTLGISAGGVAFTFSSTNLLLPGDPTQALGAATKQYVDGHGAGTGFLPLAGGTLTGNLTIAPAATDAILVVNAASGRQGYVAMNRANQSRWLLIMDATAESGSNAGSNFGIGRYSDTGTYLGTPLIINRSNGFVTIAQTLQVNGSRVISYTPTSGANPSFCCYDGGQGAAAGILLGGGNILYLANMNGDGSFASTRATIDVSGNLNLNGGNGSLTCNNVYAGGGLFQIAPNYYLQRGNDGAWRFVEGGTINSTLDTSGSLSLRGQLVCTNVSASGVVQSNPGGRLIAMANGNNPSVCVWDNSQGWAAGMFAGSGLNLYFGNMDGGGNYAGTIYGYFVHPSGDFHASGSIYSAYDCNAARDLWGKHIFTTSTDGGSFAFWVSGSAYIRYQNTYDYGPIAYNSDARLKRDIAPTEIDCLDVMRRIELVRFRWIDAERLGRDEVPIGFTTQQLRDVLDALVNPIPETIPPYVDNDGHPTGGVFYQSVNQQVMLAVLAGAMQKLIAQNAMLAARIATLETRTIH